MPDNWAKIACMKKSFLRPKMSDHPGTSRYFTWLTCSFDSGVYQRRQKCLEIDDFSPFYLLQ